MFSYLCKRYNEKKLLLAHLFLFKNKVAGLLLLNFAGLFTLRACAKNLMSKVKEQGDRSVMRSK